MPRRPRVPAELRRPSQKQILNYTVHNEVIGIFYSFPIYWRGANGPDADEIRHLVPLIGEVTGGQEEGAPLR